VSQRVAAGSIEATAGRDRVKRAAQELGGRVLTIHGERVWRPLRCWPGVVRLRGGTVLVLRHADVHEVLDRHDVFRVPYLPRMEAIGGAFILGWDPETTPRYGIEHEWLSAAAHVARAGDGDVARLAGGARAVAADRIGEGRRRGGLDVVADVADPVLDDAIGAYFGVRTRQPTPRLQWARAVFYGVFLNFFGVPAVQRRAEAAAGRLHEQFAAAAERHHAGADDVLGRLLDSQDAGRQLDRAAAARNMVGLTTAWVAQVSRVLPLALDVLLDRDAELREARDAARAGDVERVGAYVWEAARFRSQNPLVPRRCVAEHTLASGTTIPAGASLWAMLQSAMMDERAVEDPRRFRVGRPDRDYLHFGEGLHRCFGEHIARTQVAEMATALLACDGLRRAPGARGRLRWEGPFPTGLGVLVAPTGAG
jgi:cytochrome P450